jgi:hypothetical protein
VGTWQQACAAGPITMPRRPEKSKLMCTKQAAPSFRDEKPKLPEVLEISADFSR